VNFWRRALGLVFLAAAISCAGRAAAEGTVPRIVIGLFNGADEGTLRRSRLHRLAEMPLNHLGIVLVPHMNESQVAAYDISAELK
jgi:hypothetical protein